MSLDPEVSEDVLALVSDDDESLEPDVSEDVLALVSDEEVSLDPEVSEDVLALVSDEEESLVSDELEEVELEDEPPSSQNSSETRTKCVVPLTVAAATEKSGVTGSPVEIVGPDVHVVPSTEEELRMP